MYVSYDLPRPANIRWILYTFNLQHFIWKQMIFYERLFRPSKVYES